MKKHRLWYITIVTVMLAVYIIANSKETLVFTGGLILVPVVLALIQAGAVSSLTIECSMQNSSRVRNTIPLVLRIRKQSFFPIGAVKLSVNVRNNMYNEETEHEIFLQPSGERKMEFQYPIKLEDCGSVWVTVKHADFYDLPGLLKIRKTIGRTMEILVYPADIHLITELERRPETQTFGEYYDQERKGQDVSEMSGLREYEEGDSLGSVHWKLSGKFDELVVREFGYPFNYNILILYDVMKICSGQQIANQRNNAVLALTDALSYSMMEMNLEHNVGRVMEGEFYTVPVNSRSTHDQMVLNLICRPVTESMQNGDVIYHFIRLVRRNEYTKVIYITPEYEEGAVQQLSREADVTVIKVTQGMEGTYVDTPGYSVIPVDAEQYREKVHSIVI